ncbi:MAG: RNA polymerase sigma factor, partial [Mucilaginibacter sp.]
MNTLTDNALMLSVKAGDLDKMGLLFERYHDYLYGFLFHMTNQKEQSEDMAQIVFYRMLKYRHTYTGNGEFVTWMFHLARNVLKDQGKQQQKHGFHDRIDEYEGKVAGSSRPDEQLEKKQQLEALDLAMERLSNDNREMLLLSKHQDLSYLEIG